MALPSLAPKFDIAINKACADVVREKLSQGHTFALTVETGSMQPLIFPGDRVIVGAREIRGVRRGDIVCFQVLGGFGVHRVVRQYREETASVVTRGDRNRYTDNPITADEYIGVVLSVEGEHRVRDLSTVSGRLHDLRCRIEASRHRLAQIIRSELSTFVFRTQRIAALKRLYECIYNIGLKVWLRFLPGKAAVHSVYLFGSMAIKKIVPGISDIDLLINVHADKAEELVPLLLKLRKYHYRIYLAFPFISPPKVCTLNEFFHWSRQGHFYWQERRRWALIFGKSEQPPSEYGTPIKRERDFIALLLHANSHFMHSALQIIAGNPLEAHRTDLAKHCSDMLRYTEQIYRTPQQVEELPTGRADFLHWLRSREPDSPRSDVAGLALQMLSLGRASANKRAGLAAELYLQTMEALSGFMEQNFKLWPLLPDTQVRRSEVEVNGEHFALIEEHVDMLAATRRYRLHFGLHIQRDLEPERLVRIIHSLATVARNSPARPLMVHESLFKILTALRPSFYFSMRNSGAFSEADFWQCISAKLIELRPQMWLSGRNWSDANLLLRQCIIQALDLRHKFRSEVLEQDRCLEHLPPPDKEDPLYELISLFMSEISGSRNWATDKTFVPRNYPLIRLCWDELYETVRRGLGQNE